MQLNANPVRVAFARFHGVIHELEQTHRRLFLRRTFRSRSGGVVRGLRVALTLFVVSVRIFRFFDGGLWCRFSGFCGSRADLRHVNGLRVVDLHFIGAVPFTTAPRRQRIHQCHAAPSHQSAAVLPRIRGTVVLLVFFFFVLGRVIHQLRRTVDRFRHRCICKALGDVEVHPFCQRNRCPFQLTHVTIRRNFGSLHSVHVVRRFIRHALLGRIRVGQNTAERFFLLAEWDHARNDTGTSSHQTGIVLVVIFRRALRNAPARKGHLKVFDLQRLGLFPLFQLGEKHRIPRNVHSQRIFRNRLGHLLNQRPVIVNRRRFRFVFLQIFISGTNKGLQVLWRLLKTMNPKLRPQYRKNVKYKNQEEDFLYVIQTQFLQTIRIEFDFHRQSLLFVIQCVFQNLTATNVLFNRGLFIFVISICRSFFLFRLCLSRIIRSPFVLHGFRIRVRIFRFSFF